MNHQSSRKRNRKRFSLLSVAVSALAVLLFLSFGVLVSQHSPSFISTRAIGSQLDSATLIESTAPDSSSEAFQAVPSREVYPYSVIPGGVRTAQELKLASAHDPVVAEHYAGFDFLNGRVIKVNAPKLVYLSYRIGDKVYWTSKKVSLRPGETLITDGKITARGRCGNRVSELPQKNVSRAEPAIAMFDKPVDGSSMRIPFPEDFHSVLELRSSPVLGTPALGPPGAFPFPTVGGGLPPAGFLPVGSPIVPGGSGCSSGGCGGNGPGPGVPTAPVSVPEPGMLELMYAEIFTIIVIFLMGALSRRRI